MSRRRQAWGSVRRLPSRRFQARYRVDGVQHSAPRTFATKRAADAFLTEARVTIDRGTWVDPTAGSVTLRDYSTRWLGDRVHLRIRTHELYEGLLRLHILPDLGDLALVALTPARLRAWHAERKRATKPGSTTTAKAYRLLSTILATAVEDGLLTRNPCVLKGAGRERTSWSSPARSSSRSVERPSSGRGTTRDDRLASTASAPTTCDTPATRSPPPPARAPRSSCRVTSVIDRVSGYSRGGAPRPLSR